MHTLGVRPLGELLKSPEGGWKQKSWVRGMESPEQDYLHAKFLVYFDHSNLLVMALKFNNFRGDRFLNDFNPTNPFESMSNSWANSSWEVFPT